MKNSFVAYIRTSTKRQNLGLESQAAIIEQHVASVNGKLLKTYSEQECGAYEVADRPAVKAAIAHAKRSKATLIVAKLDRLARSVAVGSAIQADLKQAGTAVHVCDKPGADTLTLHIHFALAENELANIRSRTTAALGVLKTKGVALGSVREGSYELSEADRAKGRAIGSATNARMFVDAYADLFETISSLKSAGISLRAIAEALNADGQTTRQGAEWGPEQVRRVLAKAA
jgi:DNA invertase Pin-like site-specific DNA recombinase